MEVGQGEVQRESGGADSARPSSPSLQLAERETWGERFGEALLNGADTVTTDELQNNSHFLGFETNDRELVVSLQLEIKKLRDKLRSSRAKERASKTRESAKLRAKEEENREMQSVLLNMIARLSGPEP